MTVQEKAAEFVKYFETKERKDGTMYVCCADNKSEELTELCHTAHGDMMPDDWRYKFIEDALLAIADADDLDDIDVESDVYTDSLTAWLHSRCDRVYYLTEALGEYAIDDGFKALSLAQYTERREVLDLVLESLRDLVEE